MSGETHGMEDFTSLQRAVFGLKTNYFRRQDAEIRKYTKSSVGFCVHRLPKQESDRSTSWRCAFRIDFCSG